MRYSEILVERKAKAAELRTKNRSGELPTPGADGVGASLDPKGVGASVTTRGKGIDDALMQGPPFPKDNHTINNVKAMQRKLIKLGYDVGSTGVDGMFGKRTANAIAAYKKDRGITTAKDMLSIKEFLNLLTASKVAKPSPTGNNKYKPTKSAKSVMVNGKLEFPDNANMNRLAKKARAKWKDELWVAAFMAQIAHESAEMTRKIEGGSTSYFDRYEKSVNPKLAKKLGNTKDGDGARFKGRGWIQLTGRDNYKRAGKAIGVDLEKNPKLAAKDEIADKTALWFFGTNVVNSGKIDPMDIVAVTKKVNGGLNGLDDREKYWGKYITALRKPGQFDVDSGADTRIS